MSGKQAKNSNQAEDQEVLKINKWDGAAAKHAVDDTVKLALLKKPNMQESFWIIDCRLFICTIAVVVALVALGYDYKFPFPQSRNVLISCVSAYFVLMMILTAYTSFVEKGIFAVAHQQDGGAKRKWTASSDMKKYDDKYKLVVSVEDKSSGATRHKTSEKSIAMYIDDNGVVCQDIVNRELSNLYSALCSGKRD